jgi:hypothetical protein
MGTDPYTPQRRLPAFRHNFLIMSPLTVVTESAFLFKSVFYTPPPNNRSAGVIADVVGIIGDFHCR